MAKVLDGIAAVWYNAPNPRILDPNKEGKKKMADADVTVRGMYDTVMKDLNEIDEMLDSLTDAKGASQRAHVTSLVKDNSETVKSLTDQFLPKAETLDDAALVGFVTGLKRVLDATFKTRIAKYLEEWSAANPTPEVTDRPSDETIKEWEEKRREFYSRAQKILSLAESFGTLESDMVPPKKRTGSRGARGPQKWSQYVYSINGEDVEDDDNNITVLAKKFGFDKAGPLKELIKTTMDSTIEGEKKWEPGMNFKIQVSQGEDTVIFEGDFPTTDATDEGDGSSDEEVVEEETVSVE